jgi:hypothetical protein
MDEETSELVDKKIGRITTQWMQYQSDKKAQEARCAEREAEFWSELYEIRRMIEEAYHP